MASPQDPKGEPLAPALAATVAAPSSVGARGEALAGSGASIPTAATVIRGSGPT